MGREGRRPGQSFGEVADDFDRVRLGYPAALVDDVLAFSGLAQSGGAALSGGAAPSGGLSLSGAALEVGAGTGKATLAFAARGVPVVALEPDGAMADILARHLTVPGSTVPGPVRIVRATFEEYQPSEPFGLLFSADAWHWTEPEGRWRRAGRALTPGGTLALFWNLGRVDDPELRQSMLDTLARFAPELEVNDEPTDPDRLWAEWPGSELAEQSGFTDFDGRVYPYRMTMTGADYLTHMFTRSQIRMLDRPVRSRLHTALNEVFGGGVPLALESVLYLARTPRPT